MDRVAVFIDAGYLFAQGSVALAGQKLARGSIVLDHGGAADAFEKLACQISGVPLLRIYWYDGTSTGPTPQHLALAHTPRVKVRLGFVNSVGEQKGVDSLVVTDMIALARNRAMTDALLLSGDEDLRVGVQQAQELGVRVHLLGIKPSRGSQSLFLLQEADTTMEWDAPDLRPFLSIKVAAATPVPTAPSTASAPPVAVALTEVAELLVREIPEAELPALILSINEGGQIPKEIDSRLLAKSRARLKSALDPAQKKQLRAAFLRICEDRLASTAQDKEQP
jgi:uncharacterized LabA/DUF88 family protein